MGAQKAAKAFTELHGHAPAGCGPRPGAST